MKRRLISLLQRQRPFSAMYTETERFGDLRRMGSSGIVELCVQQLENSPCNLLYLIMLKKVNVYSQKIGLFL